MKFCISEVGLYYVIQLFLTSVFCCFLSVFIGLFGFVLFLLVNFALVTFAYLFRIVSVHRNSKNHNKFFSPCDGKLIKKQYDKDKPRRYTYMFKCGLLDQYAKYIPCDAMLENIHAYPKQHKYSNGVVFEFSTQSYGQFSITVVPDRLGNKSSVKPITDEPGFVVAGSPFVSICFGSLVIIQCNFEIDISQYSTVNNSTVLYN